MPKGLKGFQKGHKGFPNSGGFKKGAIGWNKGTKGICKPNSGSFKKGIPLSNEVKNKLSIARKEMWRKIKENPELYKERCAKIKESRRVWESNIGSFKKSNEHWNWKGGTSDFRKRINSSIEYKNWRKQIFKRDGWECKLCGKHGGLIDAHHIKPFSVILREFLYQYNQFSIFDDKETLLRLALSYRDFWDIDNGCTLCRDCHKETPSYSKGVKYAD